MFRPLLIQPRISHPINQLLKHLLILMNKYLNIHKQEHTLVIEYNKIKLVASNNLLNRHLISIHLTYV